MRVDPHAELVAVDGVGLGHAGITLAFDVVQESLEALLGRDTFSKILVRVLGARPSARVDDAARGQLPRRARGFEKGGEAVRTVFVVDPRGKIRTLIYYPLSLGRNFDERLRVIKALQTADHFAVATPADWRPGEPVIVPTAGSCGTAKERMEGHVAAVKCEDWFFCTKDISAEAGRVRPPGSRNARAAARLRGLSRCGPTHTGWRGCSQPVTPDRLAPKNPEPKHCNC